jgi:hypothetical protein
VARGLILCQGSLAFRQLLMPPTALLLLHPSLLVYTLLMVLIFFTLCRFILLEKKPDDRNVREYSVTITVFVIFPVVSKVNS